MADYVVHHDDDWRALVRKGRGAVHQRVPGQPRPRRALREAPAEGRLHGQEVHRGGLFLHVSEPGVEERRRTGFYFCLRAFNPFHPECKTIFSRIF